MIPTDLKLYRVKEVAEILHLSVYRVRQRIRQRRLKAWVHLGRCNTKRLFIVESDLREFIYQHFLEVYWEGLRRPKIPLSSITG
jgi:hypothetical protein